MGWQRVWPPPLATAPDGTAYRHACMQAAANIRYENCQSHEQVIDYLNQNGWSASTYARWFG